MEEPLEEPGLHTNVNIANVAFPDVSGKAGRAAAASQHDHVDTHCDEVVPLKIPNCGG